MTSSGWGSSPLTRGKLTIKVSVHCLVGLIPAHAGKTVSRGGSLAGPVAHPRSRGENRVSSTFDVCASGSSPLTRGKLDELFQFGEVCGLIPAHAGENPHGSLRSIHLMGSSPLTRGKRPASAYLVFMVGLIPAHAGKTAGFPVTRSRWRAHPRSRGENFHPRFTHLSSDGSSPLTRGKPVSLTDRAFNLGLIPAHAGKTCTSHL